MLTASNQAKPHQWQLQVLPAGAHLTATSSKVGVAEQPKLGTALSIAPTMASPTLRSKAMPSDDATRHTIPKAGLAGGFTNIERTDLGHFSQVKALVSTSCPAPVTALPADLSLVTDGTSQCMPAANSVAPDPASSLSTAFSSLVHPRPFSLSVVFSSLVHCCCACVFSCMCSFCISVCCATCM